MRRPSLQDLINTGLAIEVSQPINLSIDHYSEEEFKDYVLDLALARGWMRAHFRPAKTAKGWRTPVQGDGKGFPDLVLVRDRLIVAELKVKKKKPRPDQKKWLDAFKTAGVETYLWYPRQIQEIITILEKRQ